MAGTLFRLDERGVALPMHAATDRSERNLASIARFYRSVLNEGELVLLPELVSPNYRPFVPDHRTMPSLPPGLARLEDRLARAGRLPNTVQRIIADGDLVYAQVLYDSVPPISGVDIFRVDESGRIVEHWNVRQALAGESREVLAHRFAGPGIDRATNDAATKNRGRAFELYREVWGKGKADLAAAYYTKDYIQHNPHIESGLARIRAMISKDIRGYMSLHGTDFPIDLRHIGAEGDFVFVHFDIRMAGLGRNDGDRSTIVDIFRVDGDGMFAEHWDVCHMESDGLPDHSTLF